MVRKSKEHVVIYIPGLGDHKARGQELAVGLWRYYGVHGVVERMHWYDDRHFEIKLEHLLKIIDDYTVAGKTVSLVAASAGASAALNIYALRKNEIAGVALICGKVNNPQNMHYSVVRDNVAFGHALERLPEVLDSLTSADRKRILSVHPLADESVPVPDTRISGAREDTVPVVGHFFGIAFCLTFYAPIIVRFLKKQAKALD
jgi:pimeloyl-ACP methyl ester carboxylesterase